MSRAKGVLTRREREIFACLTDAVVAPADGLPAVAETDAVSSFDENLVSAPGVNRIALRAMLHLIDAAPLWLRRGARLRDLDPGARTQVLITLDHHRVFGPMTKALRGMAHLSYYGDEQVLLQLGFDARMIVSRTAALRARETRW